MVKLNFELATLDFETLDIEHVFTQLGFDKHSSWDTKPPKIYTFDEKKQKIRNLFEQEQKEQEEYLEYLETPEYKKVANELEIDKMTLEELNKKFSHSRRYWFYRLTNVTIEGKKAEIVKEILKRKKDQEWQENYIPKQTFIPNTEYISFTMENGNFASRNILVPKKEFLIAYPNILEFLKNNATKTHTFADGSSDVLTEYSLVNHYKATDWHEDGRPSAWRNVQSPICDFSGGMMGYADADRGYRYLTKKDHQKDVDVCKQNQQWYTNSICENYGFFNPETGNMELNRNARENGCIVKELFIFLEEYEGEERRHEYEYETPYELLTGLIMEKIMTKSENEEKNKENKEKIEKENKEK